MRARGRTDDGGHPEWFNLSQGLRQGCVQSPLLFNGFVAAVIHAVLVRFSKDEAFVRDFIQLNDAGVVGKEEQEPLACVRRAVWGMLYADDAQIVSKSAEGLRALK